MKLRYRMLVQAVCILCLSSLATDAFGQQASQAEFEQMVRDSIAAIAKEVDAQERAHFADELASYLATNRSNIASMPGQLVDDIAALLSDNEDFVRMRIASVLGILGPRAERTVDALQSALRRRLDELRNPRLTGNLLEDLQNSIAGTDSKDAICQAFKAIGTNPEPVLCVNGLFDWP